MTAYFVTPAAVEGFATSVHAMSENADRSQAVLQGWIGAPLSLLLASACARGLADGILHPLAGMFVKPKGPEEKLAKGAGHQGGMRRVTINSEIEERDAKTRRGRVEPAAKSAPTHATWKASTA